MTSLLLAAVDIIGTPPERWTDDDLERAHEIVDAIGAGDLIHDGTTLAVAPAADAALAAQGKRDVLARAKTVAEAIGRPKPTKYADVITDVAVYAAVRAA